MAHAGELMLVGASRSAPCEVGSRAEIATCSGEHHNTIGSALTNFVEVCEEFIPHHLVNSVLSLRAIESDADNARRACDFNSFKCVGCHLFTIHNVDVGFDSTRKQVRRKSDILFVLSAIVGALALVAWAAFG